MEYYFLVYQNEKEKEKQVCLGRRGRQVFYFLYTRKETMSKKKIDKSKWVYIHDAFVGDVPLLSDDMTEAEKKEAERIIDEALREHDKNLGIVD